MIKNFNSVLRKLLLGKETPNSLSTEPKESFVKVPDFPKGIPDALTQLLEVIYRVIKLKEDRLTAVKDVAKKYDIEIPTVADKYIRGLNQKTNQFDKILAQSDYNELKQLLKSKFIAYHDDIDNFFKTL